MDKERAVTLIKLIIFVLLIIIPIIAIFELNDYNFSFQDFVNYVNSFGIYTPIIIIIMITLGVIVGVVFQIPVAAAALILDYPEAILLSWIGLICGSVLSFYLARYFARDYFDKKFINKRKRLKEYNDWVENNGFFTILFLRLIYLVPFEIINILSGLSKVKFRDYLFGTMIGILPGTILTIWFIKGLKKVSLSHLISPSFLIATIIIILVTLLPLLSKRIRNIIFKFK